MQRDHFNNGNPIANEEENLWCTCFKIGVKKTTNKVVIFLHTRIRLFHPKCYAMIIANVGATWSC
jgi:hypothetical protein